MGEQYVVMISAGLASVIGLSIIAISVLAASNILGLRLCAIEDGHYVFETPEAEKTRQYLQRVPWYVSIMFFFTILMAIFSVSYIALLSTGLKQNLGVIFIITLALYCVLSFWILLQSSITTFGAFRFNLEE